MATTQKSTEQFGQGMKEQTKNVLDTAADMAGQAKDKIQEVASNVATQVKDTTMEYASAAADTTRELASARWRGRKTGRT